MKGVIADCLSKLVNSKFGSAKWHEILSMTGMDEQTVFLPSADVDDSSLMKLLSNTCSVLNLSLNDAADAFGMYWMNEYAPVIYSIYFKWFTSAKEFIMGMDSIHDATTKSIPNAHPPRFEFNQKDERTLLVTYKSSRSMIDFYIGLVKGVGHYFKTPLSVEKISSNQVQIRFN